MVTEVHFCLGTARPDPSVLQYRCSVGLHVLDKRDRATGRPEGQLGFVLDSCGLAKLATLCRDVATYAVMSHSSMKLDLTDNVCTSCRY